MSPSESCPEYYCWFDTEYTTLDLEQAALLQVAVVVTDRDLTPCRPSPAPDLPQETLRRNGLCATLAAPTGWEPSEFIREQMPDLVAGCRGSRLSVADGDELLARYLDAVVGPPAESESERPVLAGNSIHCDWYLARRDLPAFSSRLHYRLLDASAFKSEWLTCYGRDSADLLDKVNRDAVLVAFPEADLAGGAPHDAYYDVQASIAELRWYRVRLAVRD